MRNNKNRVASIVALSFIVFALVVGFLFLKSSSNPSYTTEPTAIPTPQYKPLSQPSIDTSTWKTYTDPVLKYSIKYPAAVIIDSKPGYGAAFIFPDDQNYPRDGGGEIARLSIDAIISKSKDPKEAIKENIVNGGVIRRAIRINNAYGIDTSYGTEGTETNLLYYVNDSIKSGNIIYLYLSGYSQNDPRKIETLKQILRTFRFVR